MEPWQINAFMVFGAIVSLTGIYLILKSSKIEKGEEDRSRIKILGVEIELSKSGLVIIIVGAILFCVPFIPFIKSPCPPCPQCPPVEGTNGAKIIYEDTLTERSAHNVEFLRLTAWCVNNPPNVNDKIIVEYTIKNIDNSPIKFVETYVTAYDPDEVEKSFGFSNRNRILQPGEVLKTKGQQILDVSGVWQLGPQYAIGETSEDASYPGTWKRFKIEVVQK